MTNGIGKFWQRKLVYLSLFFGIAILTFAPSQIQTTKAQLFTKAIKNSVVLLVEAELYESEQQTEGLATRFDGLSKTTLAKRIDNYAATIQSRLESTEAVIIKIPKAATPSQIQKLLANLYLYDNETIAGELTGVILIGDLQLPAVQHNGETITSIYPYVDFILPRYTVSSTDQNQEFFQLANDNLEPEIWHGVIKLENREQYASYFDKVSLTEAKETAFTPTSPKLFVADLAEETRSLNAGLIGSYQNYLNFAKAKTYNNLTAAELKLAEQNLRSGLPDQVSDKIPNQSLPLDIFAGQSLQNLAKPVVAMFQSYFNRLTPVWENTGRFLMSERQIINPIIQVGIIDSTLNRQFLAVNKELEQTIDELAKPLAKEITIAPAYQLSGTVELTDGRSLQLKPQLFFNQRTKTQIAKSVLNLTNLSQRSALITPLINQGLVSLITTNQNNTIVTRDNLGAIVAAKPNLLNLGTLHINSEPISDIDGAYACRLYRGGADAQFVEQIRDGVDPNNPSQKTCYLPYESGETGRYQKDEFGCEPFYNSELKDSHRMNLVSNISLSKTTYESCFELRTPANYFDAETRVIDPALPENPTSMSLISPDPINLNLGQILKLIEPDLELNDRNRWSSIIANLGTKTMEIPAGNSTGISNNIKSIQLKSVAIGQKKSIPSLIYHKDPTNDILNNQYKDQGLGTHFPKNKQRFLTFLGSDGKLKQINYPDLFETESYRDYLRKLNQLGTQLENLGSSDAKARLNNILTTAERNSLENFFNWRGSNLQEKYQQVLKLELFGLNAFGETIKPSAFEIAYLKLDFADQLLNIDFPEIKSGDTNSDLVSQINAADSKEETKPQQQQNYPITANQLNSPAGCSQYLATGGASVKLTNYASYLECWLSEDVQKRVTGVIALPAKFIPEFVERKAKARISRDQTLAKVNISSDRSEIINTSSQGAKITIEALDSANKPIRGFAAPVTINISNNARFTNSQSSRTTKNATSRNFSIASGTTDIFVLPKNNKSTGEIVITAQIGKMKATTKIQISKALTYQLAPKIITTDQTTATVKIKLANTETRQRQLEATVDAAHELALGNTNVKAQAGVFELPIQIPQKTGEYQLQLSLNNGQVINESIIIRAGTPTKVSLADRSSKTVGISEKSLPVKLFDRYDNLITTGAITYNNQQIANENGAYNIPVNFNNFGATNLNFRYKNRELSLSILVSKLFTVADLTNLPIKAQVVRFAHNLANLEPNISAKILAQGQVITLITETQGSQELNPEPYAGFTDTDNSLLKVSASMPIGDSFIYNQKPQTIIYGDPTFSLSQNKREQVENFSNDIGFSLGKTKGQISKIVAEQNQIAISDNKGTIYNLDQQSGLNILASLPLGIKTMTWWSGEKNSTPSLVVATNERCSQKIGCLFKYEFTNTGKLIRSELKLNYEDRINKLISHDLTQDGYEDLLVLDSQENLLLFVNENSRQGRTLAKEPVRITNIGLIINSSQNLNSYFYISANGSGIANDRQQTLDGVSNNRDEKFGSLLDAKNLASRITATDLNGKTLSKNDRIRYEITLTGKNNSRGTAKLALPLGNGYQLITSSLNCSGCQLQKTTSNYFPYSISGISYNSSTATKISFEAQVTELVPQNANIAIVTDGGNFPADSHPDILLTTPGSNKRTYFYSSRNANNRLIFLPFQENIAGNDSITNSGSRVLDTLSNNQTASNPSELLAAANATQERLYSEDRNNDGLLDQLQATSDDLSGAFDEIGDSLEAFFCRDGCLATPVNQAFFVPGVTTGIATAQPVWGLIGTPAGPIPAFGSGALIPGSFFRNYLSPTLTGELVTALCFGPFPLGGCSVIPLVGLQDLGDVCEQINNQIIDLLNQATDVVNTGLNEINDETASFGVTVGIGNTSGNSPGGVDFNTNIKVPGFPAVLTNWLSAQLHELLSILDLPEIKLILPDLASSYSFDIAGSSQLLGINNEENNTLNPIDAKIAEFENLSTTLKTVGQGSLLKLNEETITIKYPSVDPAELQKFVTSELYKKWYEQAKKEVALTYSSWKCTTYDGFSNISLDDFSELWATIGTKRAVFERAQTSGDINERACASLVLAWGGMGLSFNHNLAAIDSYFTLPTTIVELENLEAYMVAELLQYVEEVNDATIGWVNENTTRVKAWTNELNDLRASWERISAIINLSLDYKKQCDSCRTHRFSNLSFLIDFFVQIPEPPVIDLPTLPDFTLDLSDLNLGASVTLPNFEFVPIPIRLPVLPNVDLPDAPPVNFAAELPGFGLAFNLKLPVAPNFDDLLASLRLDELLPPLELPKLPLVPLPPELSLEGFQFIATLEGYIEALTKALRVVCLLENGLLPTIPEITLKEQIEAMTARPLTPLLPIDIRAGIGFKLPDLPTFEYLKEVKFIGHTYFTISFDLFVDALGELAGAWNQTMEEIVNPLNSGVQDLNSAFKDLLKFDFGTENLDSLEIKLSPTEQLLKDTAIPVNLDLSSYDEPAKTDRLTTTHLFAQAANDQNRDNTDNNGTSVPQLVTPPGIYLNNALTGTAEKVIKFVPQNINNTLLSLTDFDNDDDTDLIYNLGQEIFFKENLTKTGQKDHVKSRPQIYELAQISPAIAQTVPDLAVNFADQGETVRITFAELEETELLSIKLRPQAETIQAPTEIFAITEITNENIPDDFRAGANGLLTYSGNKTKITINGHELVKPQGSKLYLIPLNKQNSISIDKPEGEFLINYELHLANNKKPLISSNYTNLSLLNCSDDRGPTLEAKAQNLSFSIYQPITIDLSSAKDGLKKPETYYLDLMPNLDSDNDGNPVNDRDLEAPSNQAKNRGLFRIKAIEKPGPKTIYAGLIDENGNESNFPIKLEIFVPKIQISAITNNSITGSISPALENIPINIIRTRYGNPSYLVGKSAKQKNGTTVLTDKRGRFSLTGLKNSRSIAILDSKNAILAEINQDNGNVVIRKNLSYEAFRPEANKTTLGGSIKNNKGQTVTNLYLATDGLTDLALLEQAYFGKVSRTGKNGIFISDTDSKDEFKLTELPGTDTLAPGGILVSKAEQKLISIDSFGLVNYLNTEALAKVSITPSKSSNIDDLPSFEIKSQSQTIAKIKIRTKKLKIAQDKTASATELNNRRVQTSNTFVDLKANDPEADIVNYLVEKGVISGVSKGDQRFIELDRTMTRAEFTKILLNVLCIVPRPESYQNPFAFADIQIIGQMPWFYPFTKEAFLRGFVTGYKGLIDPVSKKPLFLPERSISRAEAFKVLLEVLESQDKLSLESLNESQSTVWYKPYLDYALTIKPAIITNEEASQPDLSLTRRDFIIIVNRLLKFSNCLADKPTTSADSTGTTLDTKTESNQPNFDQSFAQSGIILEAINCNVCPCPYRLEYLSDLIPNDEIMAVIKDGDGQIVGRSETLAPPQ